MAIEPDATLGVFLVGLARHGYAYKEESTGQIFLSLPEALPFEDADGTIIHVSRGGERLHDLASKYYRHVLQEPLEAVPIIAQFQPERIIDVSVTIRNRQIVLIPPPEYMQETAFGESLTDFPDIT